MELFKPIGRNDDPTPDADEIVRILARHLAGSDVDDLLVPGYDWQNSWMEAGHDQPAVEITDCIEARVICAVLRAGMSIMVPITRRCAVVNVPEFCGWCGSQEHTNEEHAGLVERELAEMNESGADRTPVRE